MAFALSGTTITQSGTDDTSSFLTGIDGNGATVTTYGNTPHSTFYIVDFGENSLHVYGDLDVDLNRITMIFTGSNPVSRLYSANGSIKLHSPQVENGFSFNPETGSVIFALDESVQWNSQTLRCNNLGSLKSEFTGVTFKGEFSAWIYGNTRFENCVIESIGNTGDVQFNIQGDVELVDVKKYASGQTGITFRGDSRNVVIDNVQVYGARDSFNNESNYSATISGLDSDTGAVADISQYFGNGHLVRNAKNGSRLIWANHLNAGSPTSYHTGTIAVVQSLIVTASDTASPSNPVAGVKLYIKDNPSLAISDATGHDLPDFDGLPAVNTRVYNKETGLLGTIPEFDILIAEGRSGYGEPRWGRVRSRGINPVAYFHLQPEPDDLFGYRMASYGHDIVSGSVVLKGSEGSRIDAVLIKDLLITEPDELVAAAYIKQDTSYKAYDHLKSLLVSNYQDEAETTVTRVAGTLDCRDLDVTIADGTGTAHITGNMLTIYGPFVGNITTTGTVTGIENVTGFVSDAVGDSQASITLPDGYDTVSLHPTAQDADDDTNALFTGTPVRYQSSMYGGQTTYLRITKSANAGTELFAAQLIPVGAGEHTFSAMAFSESAQLTNILEQLSEIKATSQAIAPALSVINNGVKKASLIVPHTVDLP